MTYYVGAMPVGDHLEHHGIKGMRWGLRRFQNSDGTYTSAGRLRYGIGNARAKIKANREYNSNKVRSFYKKNKKTIKRAAIGAGLVTAGVLGYKYRKQIGAAARTVSKKVKAPRNASGAWLAKGTRKYQISSTGINVRRPSKAEERIFRGIDKANKRLDKANKRLDKVYPKIAPALSVGLNTIYISDTARRFRKHRANGNKGHGFAYVPLTKTSKSNKRRKR